MYNKEIISINIEISPQNIHYSLSPADCQLDLDACLSYQMVVLIVVGKQVLIRTTGDRSLVILWDLYFCID
jgi:hypothetical protein